MPGKNPQNNQNQNSVSEDDIKKAVSGGGVEAPEPSQQEQSDTVKQTPQNEMAGFDEMQPSLLAPGQTDPMTQEEDEVAPTPQIMENPPGQYSQEPYDQNYSDYDYQTYQPYQGPVSTETITDIAEQTIAEKLSPIQRKFEAIMDVRTVLESKMESLSERLKRIEAIMDTLQISILEKIGKHMTSVSDLKTEIIETQKSFKALNESKSHHHQSSKKKSNTKHSKKK